jgi:hypothetical protein
MYLSNVSERLPVSIGYKLEYTTIDPSLTAYEYGFMLFDAQNKPRPAYTQLSNMMRALRGLSFVKRHASEPDVYLLEFANKTKTVMAAWSAGRIQSVRVFGKVRTLTGTPVFLVK